SVVERVAGGLRNAYDLVFHPEGGMFVHDADMEADLDTTWYRPTALFDVTEGGEFGWRPGWAKWPEHYMDRLPTLLDTGRGSPTGGVCYEHFAFPARYHKSMFLADWSEGRILNVKVKPRGAGFDAASEVFLKGQPLNVTDLEVGPDGALYFCTGGRGTAGGVYRVIYKGEVPDRMKQLGSGIARAIRQPQLGTAWARQEIAAIKSELGDDWDKQVAGVAYSNDNPPHYRVRAMDLMQLFGPMPSEELMLELSQAPSELVRARAASLLALHSSKRAARRLELMLDDRDNHVRRSALEAILRSGQLPESTKRILPLLSEDDRTLAYVARRVLERMPTETWRKSVLESTDPRIALLGMLALINAEPNQATAMQVVKRVSELMKQYMTDADFVDGLRLCQVAIHVGKVPHTKLTWFGDQVANEFPAGNALMNHELIRLAAYLQADSVVDRAIDYIESEADPADRTLVAMCLQFIETQWTAQQRFRLLKYYENTAKDSSTGSLSMYMMNVTRDFARTLNDEDIRAVLEEGSVWRNAALAAIYRLKRPIDDETAERLRELDRKLIADPQVGDLQRRLRTGIIAMLATSSDDQSMSYLRKLWRDEPERRSVIAMALAQAPDGDNWDYLVRSLKLLEGPAADEVVSALQTVQVATDDPMALRQLILLGVRAQSDRRPFENVEKLLEHWTGMQRPSGGEVSMRPWQKWFAKTYPDRPAAVLPNQDESRWDFDQLVEYLESDDGNFGDPFAGHEIYVKAKCASCHRFGNEGESIGPDLTGVARRFTRREILESVLYPAHVISSQYASKKVLTLSGQVHIGLVSNEANGILVRDANNQVTRIDSDEIDQILPSTSSAMPSGLFDDLTLTQISDLMAYMGALQPVEVAARP
ncbi:MAG: c-type cytochrome, partial [Planctomycetota bacterium]